MKISRLIVPFVFGLFLIAPAAAETIWVEFSVDGVSVRALVAKPAGDGPFPAVLYNHGSVVRERGYDESAVRGYDIPGYIEALAAAGYVGVAPVREHLTSAGYREAIIGGVATVKAAIGYLKTRADVDPARIGAIGFSEGGLVTLWSAIEAADLQAVVLMSPATIRDAGDRRLGRATKETNLARIKAPVLLTVGADDNPSIRKVTRRRLIPTMQALGGAFQFKTDYPGDHKTFWRVGEEHIRDVVTFLDANLK